MSFTHLNVSSAFSAHYGVTRPERLAIAAKSMGFDALAITDRDGLYGAVKHIGACVQLGISPIIGVNLRVVDFGRVTILAHGHDKGKGWAGLCRIISAAQTGRGKQKNIAIELKTLAELAGHCTVLIGGENIVSESVTANPQLALTRLAELQGQLATPGQLAIEVVTHLTEPGTSLSIEHAKAMLELARVTRIPSVLTNAVRYLEPDDAVTADVLDSARHLEPLGLFAPQPNAQAWLKPQSEMVRLALEITEDPKQSIELLKSTSRLADRCRLEPQSDCGWGKPKTPEQSALGIDGNPFEVLWQKTHSAIEWRYPHAPAAQLAEIQHRLSKELIAVNKLGFATYFLTVADVAQMIRDMSIRIAARGSGAGSLINYLLGISGVDPISEGLLFERFLSTERSRISTSMLSLPAGTISTRQSSGATEVIG